MNTNFTNDTNTQQPESNDISMENYVLLTNQLIQNQEILGSIFLKDQEKKFQLQNQENPTQTNNKEDSKMREEKIVINTFTNPLTQNSSPLQGSTNNLSENKEVIYFVIIFKLVESQ